MHDKYTSLVFQVTLKSSGGGVYCMVVTCLDVCIIYIYCMLVREI